MSPLSTWKNVDRAGGPRPESSALRRGSPDESNASRSSPDTRSCRIGSGCFWGAALPVYRVDHVVDGDTIALRNGQRVRLVQIDTPEVFFGAECYGRQASQSTKRLASLGSRVRLFAEPATDRVDQYGRLLRYVIRVNGAVNVNIRLVATAGAAPYFYTVEGAATRRGWRRWQRRDGEEARLGESVPPHPLRSVSRRPNAALRERGKGR